MGSWSESILDTVELLESRLRWVREDLEAGDFARLVQSVGFVDGWNKDLQERLAHILRAAAWVDVQP